MASPLQYKSCNTANLGFTLAELAIVFVIMGLIIAGVTAGQSLVKASQIQKLIAGTNEIKTSIDTFRLQYNGLPGDMRNARDYWGTSCSSTASLCNGDGNGKIDNINGAVNDKEQLRAWQHMNLAKTYPGSYTGMDGTPPAQIGVNIPEAPFSGGYNLFSDTINSFWPTSKNVIYVGGYRNATLQTGPILTPTQMSSLDTKIDDGIPYSGIIYSDKGTAATGQCITGGSLTTGDGYLIGDTTIDCVAIFQLD